MTYLGWISLAVIFGLPMTYVVLRIVGEMRADSRIRKRVAATRRTETINGREYSVVTRCLPVVRERSTGRTGIALDRGAESDPTTINGELSQEPRWIRVQFIRKSDGKAGRIEWRRYAKCQTVGTADVDFLTHRAGLFRTDSFIRYSINLKGH